MLYALPQNLQGGSAGWKIYIYVHHFYLLTSKSTCVVNNKCPMEREIFQKEAFISSLQNKDIQEMQI